MSFGTDTSEETEFLRGVNIAIGRLTTQELVSELSKRDGVKEINLKMTCAQDFRGYDKCLVIKK